MSDLWQSPSPTWREIEKKKENETAGRPQDLVKHYVASSHNQPSSLSLSLSYSKEEEEEARKYFNMLSSGAPASVQSMFAV